MASAIGPRPEPPSLPSPAPPPPLDQFQAAAHNSEQPALTSGQGTALGMMLIMASGLIFAVMSALTRVTTEAGMPAMQIVFISGAVRWMGLAIVVARSGASPLGPPKARRLLLIRSCSGMTAFSFATYAFGVMPIGDATTIFLTSPIWAALLGRIILKEHLHPIDMMTIVVALVGVVLVARPEALFGCERSLCDQSGGSGALPGSYAVIIGALFAGSVAVLVRLLKRHGDVQPEIIAHAYAFVTVILSPVGFFLPGQAPKFSSLRDPSHTISLCILIGLLAIPNQLLVNAGLLRTPAALGSMMRLVDVPATFLLQVAFFEEAVHGLSICGASLITVCTIGSAYRKWMQSVGSSDNDIKGKSPFRWLPWRPLAFGKLQDELSMAASCQDKNHSELHEDARKWPTTASRKIGTIESANGAMSVSHHPRESEYLVFNSQPSTNAA